MPTYDAYKVGLVTLFSIGELIIFIYFDLLGPNIIVKPLYLSKY
jgi:hypothetical protein